MLILPGEEHYHLLHEQTNLCVLQLYAVISKIVLLLYKQKKGNHGMWEVLPVQTELAMD